MARLDQINGERSCLLEPEHLVGRGLQCALRLARTHVSSQHALIRYNGEAWEIVDRGSHNGTRLNGELLESGRAYPLEPGAKLEFGHPSELWTLSDAAPPEVMVVGLDSRAELLGTDGIIGVPSSDEPICTVYRDSDGQWKLERLEQPAAPLRNGTVFEVAGRSFRFCCPEPTGRTVTATKELRPRESPILNFFVSSDEEYVTVSLEYRDRTVDLGSRAHNYLLLTLARTRLADRESGIAEGSCGWVCKEDLAGKLGMTAPQVDGEVFRIRKHFAQRGLEEAASVIERRHRTGQLRLGLSHLRITRA